MHLNIRDLAARTGQVRRTEVADIGHLLQGDGDVVRVEPLHVDLRISAEGGVVEAAGTLSLPAEFVCSRCLCQFCRKLTIPFREKFTRDKAETAEDEDDLHVVGDEAVDLTPFIEETVMLGLPYIPVCMPECKGLNPETGTNLNIDPAAVPEARIDPRLAVLQQWLDNESH
ncbi:YceD family protein [Paenibacillus sp. GYB003]|uniref:YceD family protein n=1 Tax=Paenibacillus sp. GYB003 TaxID=2994392 RepID=UPI002F96E46D